MVQVKEEHISNASSKLKGNDLDFFCRVWNGSLDKYQKRLNAIGFTNLPCVLDAGFGMGQWTVPLSQQNSELHGIEFSNDRYEAVSKLISDLNITNAYIQQGSIENLPYEDNKFDAIFCYSVIFLTDYRLSLHELYRVLKPGGRVYFTINGLGWYLFCLIENHNKTENYNTRQIAADTINSTLSSLQGNSIPSGSQIGVTPDRLRAELNNIGFVSYEIGQEGSLGSVSNNKSMSFYEKHEYLGHEMVYECIAVK